MKERLLGGAVLVLAAVLIVPMLLKGPDRDETQVTRELELPAAESTPARTHVVELDTDEAAAQEPVTEAIDRVTETAVAVREEAAAAGAAQATPPSRPAPAPSPDLPVARESGWAVQVGSFTSESNARRLEGLLQASDYPVFVTRSVVQGRVMYRVRVGPEPDRAGAEALAERLRADRQSTQIVEHP